ncbi:hypothetical protein [Paenibacillus eucommiae]|uniref:Uncharacterized protein n=1 Tax=Paenibacillus eucommiae TaxID=1355755 RepID=A0ABS4J3X1_9BACL|nr:hypothetical protein [Paenibacillus eucommiae]MBP1993916.1 hypothetical protein [Paenibacillus eucommiae]
MKHTMIFKRAAMSALLLSAVASPVIANASNVSNVQKLTDLGPLPSSISTQIDGKTASLAVVSSFDNPLELAKIYAPDTVNDWKNTLDKYEKLSGIKTSNVYGTLEAVPAVLMEKGANNETTSPDAKIASAVITSASIAAVENSGLKISFKEVKEGSGLASKEGKALLINGKEVTLKEATGVPMVTLTKETGAKTVSTGTATAGNNEAFVLEPGTVIESTEATLVDGAEGTMGLFKAEIELAKAAESKDSEVIKQSLGKLLEQYKLQISNLEAAK